MCGDDQTVSSGRPDREGGAATNKCRRSSAACSNPFRLFCVEHGHAIAVRCRRWRVCAGCRQAVEGELSQRFAAGIEQVPSGRLAMFATLTFRAERQPDEDEAHGAFRSLVARLRYRGYLGEYGWTLQRTGRGTLHHHAVMWLPWFEDDLAEWCALIVASGYDLNNRLTLARREHAFYIGRYIASRMATLAPGRRAYGFSRNFPPSSFTADKREREALLSELGAVRECEWLPAYLLDR